ncbi:MAG: AAA family ATPase [Paracoccus sp. (in: a-proteobacteria)]
MKDPDYIRTEVAADAAAMCRAVLDARPRCQIGQITGKTALTEYLATELTAIRIEVWAGINNRDLLRILVDAANTQGLMIDPAGTANAMLGRLMAALTGRLVIVDEANHLSWKQLEILRGLSDLGRCGLILVGTDILARNISGDSTYLAQLRRRIGAKRVELGAMKSDEEVLAYCIQPRFGSVSRKTVQAFRKATGGVWGFALELGNACERLLAAEGIEKLDETVVQTAAAWMAGAGK